MAWNQEEFERRNPRSEALRAAQAQEFLDRMTEVTARNREAYQREIPGIGALLMQIRSQGVPENLSIDQMKALGLYVPEYKSIPLTERPLQTQLPLYSSEAAFDQTADIPSVKRAVQQIESTPIPRSVGGNRMAGRLGKLLIPLITGTSAGVLLDDVIAANQAERMPVPIDKESVAKLAAAELLAQAVS
jgi:hypothetical protein